MHKRQLHYSGAKHAKVRLKNACSFQCHGNAQKNPLAKIFSLFQMLKQLPCVHPPAVVVPTGSTLQSPDFNVKWLLLLQLEHCSFLPPPTLAGCRWNNNYLRGLGRHQFRAHEGAYLYIHMQTAQVRCPHKYRRNRPNEFGGYHNLPIPHSTRVYAEALGHGVVYL